MSFCGFVSFSTAEGAEQAEHALRVWVSRTAASRNDNEWAAPSNRGWMCAFSLVVNPGHAARLQREAGGMFVGDVPVGWWDAPDGSERPWRLLDPASRNLSDLLPESEFALATWAEPASRLTLYRCRFGARALLYVCRPGQWLAFASLPEPLLTIPGVRTQIDERALAAHLGNDANGRQAPDATIFTQLRRVPAAHTVRFTKDRFVVEPYWGLEAGPPMQADADDPEVPRSLLGLLETAIKRRVSGIRRVGTQLSGGMDSSAVTALAHAHREPDARFFTYTIKGHDAGGHILDPEEWQLSMSLGLHLPGATARVVPHHRSHRPYFLCQPHYLARPLPDMVFWLGPDHRLLERARQDGCSVMLTGWGGDHMVSSRTRLHVLAMFAERRWRLALLNLLPHDEWSTPMRTLWRDVAAPLRSALMPRARRGHLTDQRIRAIFGGKPLAGLVSTGRGTRRSLSVRRNRLEGLGATGNSLMLELQDWLGQRAGIAASHPLFDRDVVTFANRMPAEWIGHLGVTRRAFRTALTGILPQDHLLREKGSRTARAAPFARVQHHGLFVQRAIQDLARSSTWLHEYVNLQSLAAASRNFNNSGGFDPTQQICASVLVVARLER